MSIVSHQIVSNSLQRAGRRVVYEYTFHNGDTRELGPKILPDGVDIDADRGSLVSDIEDQRALEEVMEAISLAWDRQNPDRIPDHQTQAEFDRRVLGQMMLVDDAHAVLAAYPMFQAVELRGGANANQRADYLGMDVATYNLIDDRFSNVNGVAWFLTDEKNQLWDELPEGYY